ncbi:MAG: type II toxin-antitoxin system Phd/YefM family antitoxin [Frankiaceae bacterium]
MTRIVMGLQLGCCLTNVGQRGEYCGMVQVNVYEAKTQLSRLLDAVAAGDDVVIARAGRPIARLIPYAHEAAPRRPGAWRGRVQIAEDFDEWPAELETAFFGEAE